MTDVKYRDYVIAKSSMPDVSTNELRMRCVNSVSLEKDKEDVVRVWIENASNVPSVPKMVIWIMKRVAVIYDTELDCLKQVCDGTEKIDLYVGDYDFLYENTKSYITNHRDRFGDVYVVKFVKNDENNAFVA